MDSLITAAARALAAGDPLGALKRIALRADAPALALRGIAMAQLGDLTRARDLLRRAARAFSSRESVARARCVVAEAEIALAARNLSWPARTLDAARATLEAHGDHANATYAGYLKARRFLLIGRIENAERTLADLDPTSLPPGLRAAHALTVAGIEMRRLRIDAARAALVDAGLAADRAAIPALKAEVASVVLQLTEPAARVVTHGGEQLLRLDQVEMLLASPAFIVDACRHVVRQAGRTISFAKRPVLFKLARLLSEAWPDDAARDTLVARTFKLKLADESHRARLRVEIGRLRKALGSLAGIVATRRGFALQPRRTNEVVLLTPPVENENAAVLALLADGESWSSSALALALGISQRSVQRDLDSLAAAGKVRSFGRARARRWASPPVAGFATALLLPAHLPID
jgi:hypothetical protein